MLALSVAYTFGASAAIAETERERYLGILMDLIIPRTKTPSATDMLIHINSEFFVSSHFNDVNELYKKVANLATSQELYLDKNSFVHQWIAGDFGPECVEIFYFIKDMSVRLYCSTEYVANNTFEYLKTPGCYIGSYPFNKVGKIWAI
jgi:hypothetical protein